MRRQVYDKRTLRRMNRLSFEAGIAAYIDEAGIQLQNVSSFTYGGGGIRVLARKRPLFDHEVQNGEFDVIRVTKEGVVVHSCLMKADLRAPFLANHFCPGERHHVPSRAMMLGVMCFLRGAVMCSSVHAPTVARIRNMLRAARAAHCPRSGGHVRDGEQ